MVANGYADSGKSFTFDGSKWTELQNADKLTVSVAKFITEQGKGAYAVSFAGGTHTMTLTYDGSTYNLLDQGSYYEGNYHSSENSAASFDQRLESITTQMLKPHRAKYTSIIKIHKLIK